MNSYLVKVNNVVMQGVKGLGLKYGYQEDDMSKASKDMVRKLINEASQYMITNPDKARKGIAVAYRFAKRIDDVSYRYAVDKTLQRYAGMLGLTLKR